MELLVVLLLGGGLAWFMYNQINKPNGDSVFKNETPTVPPMPEPQPAPVVEAAKQALDLNKDGKVDLADAKEAVKKTRARVKKAADLDGDGRVTVKDVKVAASRARKAAGQAATKAASKASKAVGSVRAKK